MSDWMSRLCTHLGISSHYTDFEGQKVTVSPDTQVAVLRAMEMDASSDAAAKALLEQLQADDRSRPAPFEVIVEAGQSYELTLAHSAKWWIEAEGTGETIASGTASQNLSLPALPMGIHALRLTSGAREYTTWLLARPSRATRLEDHIHQARIWGVLAPLYGLTNGADLQIGSYASLGEYAAAMAQHGADFLGINPVHAMGDKRPNDLISPYSPSHRAFLNTWYCSADSNSNGDIAELVDYPAALQNRSCALRDAFSAFCALPKMAPEKQAFQSFAAQMGAPLHKFALFEALSARFGSDWRDWPAPYRLHDTAMIAAFEAENAEEISWIKWAQWQAELQLKNAQTLARDSGMRVGLYLDLAVGPRLGGAETWVEGNALVTGATLGAPPDPLGPSGQSWGLAPLSPIKCRKEGYAGFAHLLRQNMRHAGMIRIDHILGLMRCFWIPDGSDTGTYVSYPFEALLAVVAIESARNHTIVVGEDLGLVPAGLREKLAASGIYGLDVLQYMREQKGGFVDTAETRALAVCTFATHDTPTVAGFFEAEDAQVRFEFGGIDEETLEATKADRTRAQATLAGDNPVVAIHERLARANASMVAVQLDDIAERKSQQNLPGTVDTYPNWRLKAPFTVDGIVSSDSFAQLGREMADQGRSNLLGMEKEDVLQDCSDHAH